MFEESRVAVPGGDREAGTWGGVVVPDGRGGALTTLPSDGARTPLIRFGLPERRVEPHGDLRGDLRDACFDDAGRLWLLSTHGLAVFDPVTREPLGVVEQGLGQHKWNVVAIGAGLLGVSSWSARTTTIVSASAMRVVKQLRFPALELVAASPAGEPCLYSFHAGAMATFEPKRHRTTHPRELPTGTGPVLVGATIHLALGRRRRIDRHIPVSEQWRVHPTRLVSLDAATLHQQRSVRAPRGFCRFLGVDSHGRLVAQTATTIRLLDPTTYRTLATWTPTDHVGEGWSACHLAPHDAVVIRPQPLRVPELTVLTW